MYYINSSRQQFVTNPTSLNQSYLWSLSFVHSGTITIHATVDLKAVKSNLSKRFLEDLDVALNLGNDEKKRVALLALFEHYGHVFATRITLGGSIISSDIQRSHNLEQINSKKNDVAGSVKVPFFGGKAGGGSEKENTSRDRNDDARQSSKILGGNQTYAPKSDEEPSEQWVSSIQKNCEYRSAIRGDNLSSPLPTSH